MAQLRSLLVEIPDAQIAVGDDSAEVRGVVYDSRQVSRGDAFVCIRGLKFDGHNFIPAAIKNGASVIVADNAAALADLPAEITGVIVPDTRRALALMASAFYDFPSRKLLLVGITGTNGKTTTAHLIAELLREAGYKNVGTIGTLGAAIGGNIQSTRQRTTPESSDLQKILAEFVKNGAEAVVMEVSSHALAMQRVAGCAFDAGIFTNLTQDHLDFHETMEKYFYAKAKLFSEVADYSAQFKNFGAVINADDSYGRRIQNDIYRGDVVTYGIENTADIAATSLQLTPLGSSFVVSDKHQFEMSLTGRFNVYNALAAIAFGQLQGISTERVQRALKRVSIPEGRMEMIDCGQDFHVGVDYAHTPDGLQKVLLAIHEFSPRRIITVFGCGGDRDHGKRPKMGAIVAELSDICVVTSDNPRSEEPQKIIEDILAGMNSPNSKQIVEPDRRAAIQKALSIAQKDDFVLIAGKGHETYQIFKDETVHFDDREEVRNFLKK